jgi:hypothetical protein
MIRFALAAYWVMEVFPPILAIAVETVEQVENRVFPYALLI